VDGDASSGILGTVIGAAFLNALNNHRHDGVAEDGHGALDYAADSGSANAYVVALSPALAAHVAGMPIFFRAANANTGASTVNINGLGAVAIRKYGLAALEAGDIAAGQIVGVIYDGTYYQLIGTQNFGHSLASSGYQRLPGGLILQWGSQLSATGVTITFPVAFPNVVGSVHAIAWSQPDGGSSVAEITSLSLASVVFTITNSISGVATDAQIRWFAIGY
jgi:hypothetical protein